MPLLCGDYPLLPLFFGVSKIPARAILKKIRSCTGIAPKEMAKYIHGCGRACQSHSCCAKKRNFIRVAYRAEMLSTKENAHVHFGLRRSRIYWFP
ncbi:hypothetical protein [Desulfovibrio intestinalis]|uniref:Uncharacterized protein n=1 Tax=Desulfovibrio intestinalis TaxID=58621 RepID=A0A7W8C2P9_9BACT|nr:hypothetical protein [Desulfovibrio intestinalis]MBB5144505.1 hypothetical protein [Desulfovibrio intestinalis]